MAFNQELESDKPSNMPSLLKHPLLGALVWLFGSSEDDKGSASSSARSKARNINASGALNINGSRNEDDWSDSDSSYEYRDEDYDGDLARSENNRAKGEASRRGGKTHTKGLYQQKGKGGRGARGGR